MTGVQTCALPILAAVANAIHDAIGIRMHEMPATPRRILEHLLEPEGE